MDMGRVHLPYRPAVFRFNQILLKLMAVTIKASAVANPGFAKLPETDYTSVEERSGTLKVKGVEQSVTFLDFKKEGKTFASVPDISLPYVLLEDEGRKPLGLLLAGETVVFPKTGTLSSKSTDRTVTGKDNKKYEVYDVILSSCKLTQFKRVTQN